MEKKVQNGLTSGKKGGRNSSNQIHLQIFDSYHQCYSIILQRLVSGVREMN